MNNPLLRDATDEELAKASPRELFQMAQEWPRDHENIQEMGLGLSDLYISETGKSGIKIIALVAKNFSDKSKFQVENLKTDHPNAIHFYIRKKPEKNPHFGLMEIDEVGFDGM
ncbi:Protein CBG26593 [Caenorhabditis briggsae]|uniref:Protein CBG26593 n=1 Tax=Caenorhabditis briggsae TaxID=6238 RepID=B6IKZ3_CAEBR|nr:Protein CBG26593 [Caenorhabditis briggsae]CAS00573.1 Protein CBG26593 [Caenorhabditis briggsae]